MAGADVVTIPSGPDSYLKSNEVRSAALLPPSCQRGHTLPLDVFVTTRAAGANAAETACFIACQGRLEIRQGLGLGASAGREVTPAKRTEVASCCSCFVAALRAAGSAGVVAAAGIFRASARELMALETGRLPPRGPIASMRGCCRAACT